MDPIKNLITLIQEKLQEIPLAVRQKVYSYGAILAALYTLYVAANGDWNVFWKSLIATAVGVLARANATAKNVELPDNVKDLLEGGNTFTEDTEAANAETVETPVVTPEAGVGRYGNTLSGE